MRHEIDLPGRCGNAELVALGRERHWVLGIDELRALGWTERRVRGAVARGLLYRRFLGVYAIGRPELSFDGLSRAAWLAAGPGSGVSHISAAASWGLRGSTGAIHVSVRVRAGPGPA